MTQRLHTNELLAEYIRIFNDDLRVQLGLRAAMRGSIEWYPMADVPSMVNGIWVSIEPDIRLKHVQLPNDMEITYNIRILFVRKININENVLEQKVADLNVIVEKLIDKFRLPELSLTNGQVMWSLPTQVETEPPEDALVAQIASDLVATAFRVETIVRVRR